MSQRVLHIGKFFPPDMGGMEVYLSDLIAAQHAQGIQAAAIVHGTPCKDDPEWLWRVPVQINLLYAPIALSFRSTLVRAISIFKPDALHLHMPNVAVFWALTLDKARDIPWIVHWHSDVVVTNRLTPLAIAYCVYRPLEQAVLACSVRVIATSLPYLEASEPLSPWRSKCVVVPLGLKPPKKKEFNREDLWHSACFRVLAIGRLTYYKGFETLIAAASSISGLQLLIAGGGELRVTLDEQIERLQSAGAEGKVQLLGNVSEDEKHKLLASCDLFCLPSIERTEAFGMVLLEAMAHARPCMVSALPGSGMKWLIDESKAGISCEAKNVESWTRGLVWMMENENHRRAMGENGQKAFAERFVITESARLIRMIYPSGTCLHVEESIACERLLIVIPARNEAATIGQLLRNLRDTGYCDVLVIDDQSNDGTGDIARMEGATVLRPALGLGAWGGMQAGIRYGLKNGFTKVLTMDADGQHEVSGVAQILDVSCSADVVIGAFPLRASKIRQIAWAWFRFLTGLDVEDLTSGFRVYSTEALHVLSSDEATLFEYQDIGTLLLLRSAGLNIRETPVFMSQRISGKSRIFHSWVSVGRYMAITTLLCISRWGVPARLSRLSKLIS